MGSSGLGEREREREGGRGEGGRETEEDVGHHKQIGRASCRERVWISVVAVLLKKK